MRRVTIVQHVACETAGALEDLLRDVGIEIDYVRPYLGDPIPATLRRTSGLVVMGGPMGVYQTAEFPYLRDEIQLIRHACHEGVPVLGICLGSQLLASALGAEVRPSGLQEIGWHPVGLLPKAADDCLWKELPREFVPLHWHGDIFDVPEGATPLAESALTATQAFCWGQNAYGILFHLESTADTIRDMVDTFDDDLHHAGIEGQALLAESELRLPAIAELGRELFRRWSCLVVAYADTHLETLT